MRQRTGWAVALALTLLRLALAPIVIVLAARQARPMWLAGCLAIGLLSDVFDGIVARRANASTPGLRLADSVVDTVFYLAIAAAAWLRFPDALRPWGWAILVIIACEFANYGASLLKFGKGASYHAYSAKTMGVALFAACGTLFLSGSAVLLPPALGIAFVAQLEVAAITWILVEWQHDVRTVAHAIRFRDAQLAEIRS